MHVRVLLPVYLHMYRRMHYCLREVCIRIGACIAACVRSVYEHVHALLSA